MKKERKRRSGMKIMLDLIGLVKPLLHIMIAAVLLGTLGYLCAIFLTILAGKAVLEGVYAGQNVRHIFILMVAAAILRGLLHYAEQYCNHFIAFKLLAIIRHKVFAALRKLCPAKLEGRDRGNLISIITTDIELLEVFYAHTISPIVIAVLTSLVMLLFIGRQSLIAAGLAFIAYVIVGGLIPFWNGRRGGEKGMEFRSEFGKLNSFVLDSLRGLDETLQYGQGKNQKEEITRRSIGTAHGAYNKGQMPYLDYERLVEIKKVTNNFPLVLHGGSGTGDEGLAKVAKMGINKVNIGCELFASAIDAIENADTEGNGAYGFANIIEEGYGSRLKHFIRVLDSEGKAWEVKKIIKREKVELTEETIL